MARLRERHASAATQWAKRTGAKEHPEWYQGASGELNSSELQPHFWRTGLHDCRKPCGLGRDLSEDTNLVVRAEYRSSGMIPSTRGCSDQLTMFKTGNFPCFSDWKENYGMWPNRGRFMRVSKTTRRPYLFNLKSSYGCHSFVAREPGVSRCAREPRPIQSSRRHGRG